MKKMLQRVFQGFAGAFALALTITPLWAHHGIAVKFDPSQRLAFNGRVVHVDWSNPHVHIFMTASEPGPSTTWYVELESTILLERNGWDRNTLRPGDLITVEGFLARDGSRQAWGESVVLTGTGRRVLYASNALLPPSGDESVRPTPRWPDGQPRLGPPPGESGYWVPVSPVMMEDGANVEIDAHGFVRDIGDAPKVAPFQDWARALYQYRQRNFLRSDPMFLDCKPAGGPRKFQSPYGVQFIEDRTFQRIFVVAGGGNRDWHLIYTDGRPHDGGFGVDDGNLLYYGRGVAHWEDDTLIIDSRGFNEKFWFSNGGLPHTEELRLIERVSRPDLDTLVYQVTVDDPGAYTRNWTSTWTLKWVPGDPPEYYCQDNRP